MGHQFCAIVQWIAFQLISMHNGIDVAVSSRQEELLEFCEAETFFASCSHESQVLLIRHALYGRMKLGRCVIHDYGYVGCYADVAMHLDSVCSGNKTCQIHIPDVELDRANPCPRDFKTYLEVSYECITVQTVRCGTECGDLAEDDVTSADTNSAIPLQPTWLAPVTDSSTRGSSSRYVLGLATENARCEETGNRLCPIVLRVSAGQTIQVSLWELEIADFDQKPPLQFHVTEGVDQGLALGAAVNYKEQRHRSSLATTGCHRYAVIRDVFAASTSQEFDVCGQQTRIWHVYTSHGNELHVYVTPSTMHVGRYKKFLLEYKPIGCPDVMGIPSTMTSRRKGPVLILRCLNSAATFHMVCSPRTNKWRGNFVPCSSNGSNASESNVSRNVSEEGKATVKATETLIVITACVAVVMGSTVLVAGFIAIKRCNTSTNQKCPQSYPMRPISDLDNEDVTCLPPANQRPRYALTMYQSVHSTTSTETDEDSADEDQGGLIDNLNGHRLQADAQVVDGTNRYYRMRPSDDNDAEEDVEESSNDDLPGPSAMKRRRTPASCKLKSGARKWTKDDIPVSATEVLADTGTSRGLLAVDEDWTPTMWFEQFFSEDVI